MNLDSSVTYCTPTRVACCTSRKGDISLIHLDKAAVTSTLSTPRLQLSAVAFSSDGSGLAVSSLSGHMLVGKVDQTENNEQLPRFSFIKRQRLQDGIALCLDWHCAGECIATGGLDSFVRTFALEKSLTGSEERRFESHKAPVMGTTFFVDGFTFASCDSDGVVLKWDLRNSSQVVQLIGEMLYGHGRNCIRYSPEGNHLLTGNTDGSLTLFNLITNKVEFYKHISKNVAEMPDIANGDLETKVIVED
ncbi:WD repeat, SAM and U-box domain-containing protein [Echinococcus granulosus]|uniref:WD repeat, SAM and U-box domain-containing protein n=1 Tax=Echinococcus granulosus TaxID=6210 RepID=W6UUE6_ECHGR|nr:WD repeat, SAM and U-box domain-containing protein [Echinococcus granulosus]EUB64296.1 WD repeat, SAM and U-box domain-containing protein [Echinococcus granulosus]